MVQRPKMVRQVVKPYLTVSQRQEMPLSQDTRFNVEPITEVFTWCVSVYVPSLFISSIQNHCRTLSSYKTLFWNLHRMKIHPPKCCALYLLIKRLEYKKKGSNWDERGRGKVAFLARFWNKRREGKKVQLVLLLFPSQPLVNTEQLFFPILLIFSNRRQNKFSHQKYLECEWLQHLRT